MGFYSWPDDDLDDRDVANILGITPGALRTRTSRLCAKVKRLVNELNDALIAALNKQSLEIAREIYAEAYPDMESVLEELLGQSERELEQYGQIVELRREKRDSLRTSEKLGTRTDDEMCMSCSSRERFMDIFALVQSNRIIRMFKELIGM